MLLPLRLNLHGTRILLTLKDASCNPIVSTLVMMAVFLYGGGIVSNPSWMILDQKGTPTTDVNGVLSIPYTGSGASGDTVYVAIIIPGLLPQSVLWTTIIT